ncbi:hypothetical protein [Cystobacter fuscus]|uniref:hypothetical protein n=1 Tax=Cystobacter fuscus TaxID=43 RepID=UPI002B29F205|nr:VWA domain-containing protein [Cystobacter fuscus]
MYFEKWLRWRRGGSLAVLLVTIGLGGGALAFKVGFHEDLTERLLRGQGFDEDSSDEVGDSNYYTDVFEASSEDAHADGNMLGPASQRLRQKRRDIGDALNACERRDALDALGEALHTVQDVYSHSNSIDNGHAINDLLGMINGTATCSLPDFAPGGLVTGYFSLGGIASGNQCRGIPAGMCCHRELNKDSPSVPNGARHGAALNAAGSATLDYLQLIEQDLRARFGEPKASQLIKLLKRKQRMLYFAIDTTGSMGTDLAGVKSAVGALVEQVLAGEEMPQLGLVTFKDSVSDSGLTCDAELLRSRVNALYASGGDDCPEASNSALMAALLNFPYVSTDMMHKGGRVVLATDASAGDAYLGPQVVNEAAARGVSIDAILTGDCTAEEFAGLTAAEPCSVNEPTEAPVPVAQVASAAADPLVSGSARTQLRAVTEQTGGVLFNVSRLEVDDVVPTLLELSEPDSAILFSRKVQLRAGVPSVLEMPVDDTLRRKVTFMVTASRAGALPTFTLRRPNGATVASTDPDVAYRVLTSVKSYAVTTPATGRWSIRLEGEGTFVLRVFGGTSFRVNGLRLQVPADDQQRPEVETLPIEGQPVVGSNVLADVRLTYVPRSLALSLRRLDGSLVQDLVPSRVDELRWFRSPLVIPGELFVFEVTGMTPDGHEFVRQVPTPVVPQTLAVRASPETSFALPGSTANVEVVLQNHATVDATFRLNATSSLGWPISAPTLVPVAAGASVRLAVSVHIPSGATQGQRTAVTFFAQDVSAPQVRNSATVSVVVGNPNQPPVCTQAVPTLTSLWPPNHQLVDVGILGIVDADGDAVSVSISGITQDEPVIGQGSGNTTPDGEGLGTSVARLRAERSGNGNGRVYTVQFTASDGKGGSCTGSVQVAVPHSQGKAAVDDGPLYRSSGNP